MLSSCRAWLTVVDAARLRTRWLSSQTIHVSYTPDVSEQTRWNATAMMIVRYDVVHQLDAGEIQVLLTLCLQYRDDYYFSYGRPA